MIICVLVALRSDIHIRDATLTICAYMFNNQKYCVQFLMLSGTSFTSRLSTASINSSKLFCVCNQTAIMKPNQ